MFSKNKIDALLRQASIGCKFSTDNRKQVSQLWMFADEVPARDALFVFIAGPWKRPDAHVREEDLIASKLRAGKR